MSTSTGNELTSIRNDQDFRTLCAKIFDLMGLDQKRRLEATHGAGAEKLKPCWEAFHLRSFVKNVLGRKPNNDTSPRHIAFERVYRAGTFDEFMKAFNSNGHTPQNAKNAFLGLAPHVLHDLKLDIPGGLDLALEFCVLEFLRFCLTSNLPVSLFQTRDSLKKVIQSLETYIKEVMASILGAQGEATPREHNSESLGLKVSWDCPNNTGERPVCKIAFDIGAEDLIIPKTTDCIELDRAPTVLRWSSRITSLIGRRKELEALTQWLNSDAKKSIHLIAGGGGTGKTRLAFEFAEAIRSDGWTAGQVHSDIKGCWRVGKNGIVIIIDYPEESKQSCLQFLRAVYELAVATPDPKVRILLLTRNPAIAIAIENAAPALLSATTILSECMRSNERWELVEACWASLGKLDAASGMVAFPFKRSEFDDWADEKGITTPLLTLAAAYYFYGRPNYCKDALASLSSRQVIRHLTAREFDLTCREARSQSAGNALEAVEPFSLCFVRAMAGICGGLSSEQLSAVLYRLSAEDSIRPPRFRSIISTSLWIDHSLAAIAPDMLAADFLAFCLEQTEPNEAGSWIIATLGIADLANNQDWAATLKVRLTRLARMIFDVTVKLGAEIRFSLASFGERVLANDAFCRWACQDLPSDGYLHYFKPILLRAITKEISSSNSVRERARLLLRISELEADAAVAVGNAKEAVSLLRERTAVSTVKCTSLSLSVLT